MRFAHSIRVAYQYFTIVFSTHDSWVMTNWRSTTISLKLLIKETHHSFIHSLISFQTMSMAASASSHACVSPIATCIPSSSSKFSSSSSSSSSYCSWLTLSSPQRVGSNKRWGCRAMVQQAVQGAPAAYAKEMERLSAKESLLLAVSLFLLILFPICVFWDLPICFGPLFCVFVGK